MFFFSFRQLILGFDEQRYITLVPAFQLIFERYCQLHGEEDDDLPDHYIKVRKLIVTPTQQILMPPEVVKSNRVLRKFGEDYAIRILFRDENGRKLMMSTFNIPEIRVLHLQ